MDIPIIKVDRWEKTDSAGLFHNIQNYNNPDETENFPTTNRNRQDTLSPRTVVIVGDTAGLGWIQLGSFPVDEHPCPFRQEPVHDSIAGLRRWMDPNGIVSGDRVSSSP